MSYQSLWVDKTARLFSGIVSFTSRAVVAYLKGRGRYRSLAPPPSNIARLALPARWAEPERADNDSTIHKGLYS